MQIIYRYFLYPILILSTIGTIYLYLKYLRKLSQPTSSKIKKRLQDIFTVSILTCVFSAILCGLTFSAIVTTNAFSGPRESTTINEPVIEYEPYTTKWGRLRHYIKFKNPNDNKIIRLEVYRKYEVGETFSKGLKIGKWGLVYSVD